MPVLPTKEFMDAHDADPIIVSVSDPLLKSQGMFRSKVALYTVRASSREALTETQRAFKDFVQLQKLLMDRFKGACIPPVPPEKLIGATEEAFVTKRMHLLESFLQAITANAFMRNDFAFKLFVTDKQDFSKAVAAAGAAAEASGGVLQWKQALEEATEAEEAQMSDALRELDVVEKSFTQIKSATKATIQAAEKFAEANASLGMAFEAWQTREEGQVSVLRGVGQHIDGSKVVLAHEVKGLVRGQTAVAAVLQLEYGSVQLRSILLDAVRFEMAQIEQWRMHLNDTQSKAKATNKATEEVKRLQVQLGVPGKNDKQVTALSKQLQDAKQFVKDTAVESSVMRKGVAVELDRYRKDRAVRTETLVALLKRFHLRGAVMLQSAWADGGEGLEGLQVPAGSAQAVPSGGSFFRRKSFTRTPSGQLRLKRNGSAADVLAQELQLEAQTKGESRQMAIESDQKKVALRVNKDYVAKKSDELDLKEGDMLTAVRIDDFLWLATNAQGKSGLVPSSHVGVPPQTDAAGSQVRASIAPHDGLRPRVSVIQPMLPINASLSLTSSEGGEVHTAPPPGLFTPPPGPPPPSMIAPPAEPFMTGYSIAENSDNDEDTFGAPPPLPPPRLSSAAGGPPQMPEWMQKRGSFNQDLPALPSNAAAMAALKAKLQHLTS